MSEVYIIAAVRTPLIMDTSSQVSRLSSIDLSAVVLGELVHRSRLSAIEINDVIWSGCGSDETSPVACIRLAMQQAGLPTHIPAAAVNRHTLAGHQAVHAAAQAILAGDQDLVIAGGADTLSTALQPLDYQGHWLADPQPAFQAEVMAEKWNLSRAVLDDYVLTSLEHHSKAQEQGFLQDQVIRLEPSAGNSLDSDQPLSRIWSKGSLAGLPGLHKPDGAVTQAHLSVPASGAVALLLASPRAVGRLNLNPLAIITSRAISAADFSMGLTGSLPATAQAVKRAGLAISDLDYILVEEISACSVLAWIERFHIDPTKVNPHGGALAQGRLPAAGGALLMTRLLYTLSLRDGHYGLAVSVSADGMGMATVIERL